MADNEERGQSPPKSTAPHGKVLLLNYVLPPQATRRGTSWSCLPQDLLTTSANKLELEKHMEACNVQVLIQESQLTFPLWAMKVLCWRPNRAECWDRARKLTGEFGWGQAGEFCPEGQASSYRAESWRWEERVSLMTWWAGLHTVLICTHKLIVHYRLS